MSVLLKRYIPPATGGGGGGETTTVILIGNGPVVLPAAAKVLLGIAAKPVGALAALEIVVSGSGDNIIGPEPLDVAGDYYSIGKYLAGPTTLNVSGVTSNTEIKIFTL